MQCELPSSHEFLVGQSGKSMHAPPGFQAQSQALPLSSSFQSSSMLMSPAPTPQSKHRSRRSESFVSPALPSGRMTEPRNYAPRTSGLPILNEPPPKFDLGLFPYHSSNSGLATPDEFPEYLDGSFLQAASDTSVVPYQESTNVSRLRSEKLNSLTSGPSDLPTLQAALDPVNFPFTELAKQSRSENHGVVRLGNIPFATKRSEVIAFLGRNSKILNDADEPVHIIMEKVSSKTMDAYIEFRSLEDAMRAVEKHQQNAVSGRFVRLGDRPVDLELSSQANLMRDLFPIAKGVFWNGSKPEIQSTKPREPWENFKGFVSEEEMTMLVKHVEVPHRSPFSKECPQRPYECLISTLKKFPWYMTDHITIKQRGAIFKATVDLCRLLVRSIHKEDDQVNLTQQLLRRVIAAAMKCPGFTTLMKDDIACITEMADMEQRSYGQPRFASSWRHQYALVAKAGTPLDVIEWYIAVIREQTIKDVQSRPHSKRGKIQEMAADTDMYWGYLWVDLAYPLGPDFDSMTLAQVANVEFAAVEAVLARALAPN